MLLVKRALPSLCVSLTVTASAIASRPQQAEQTFEVVSIKQNVSGVLGEYLLDRPDGGYQGKNVIVGRLIAEAYPPLVPNEIDGLPDWAKRERYDILAKSSIVHPTQAQRRAMLRAMLIERFKLTAHSDSRDEPVFDLMISREDGRLGPSMARTKDDCAAVLAAEAEAQAASGVAQPPDRNAPLLPCHFRVVDTRMEGDTTMAGLAFMLRAFSGRVVIDKTGLDGYYHVAMTFDPRSGRRAPGSANAAIPTDGPPSVFTAIRDDLGLKLESSRAQRGRLIIDHIERPTSN